jgi:hypothetical protein
VDHVFREVNQMVDHLAKQWLPFNIVLRFLILLLTLFPCLYWLTMLVLVFLEVSSFLWGLFAHKNEANIYFS